MSYTKLLVVLVLFLVTAVGAFLAGARLHQPNIFLGNISTALEAAEGLEIGANPETRKALEQIAILHLSLAAKFDPSISEFTGIEMEGLCRATRYFSLNHQSKSSRDPQIEELLSGLIRPYLESIAEPLKGRVTSNQFSKAFTPQCAEVFGVAEEMPCPLKSGCNK